MTWAIVPAAGRGRRVGGSVPKQYLPLNGEPMLIHTLRRLAQMRCVSGLAVGLDEADQHWPGVREIAGRPVLRYVGGQTRAETVLNGLDALPAEVRQDDWVLVHDAARPCVAAADVDRLVARCASHPVGGLLATPMADTLKQESAGEVSATVPRDALWRAQTPQIFRRGNLSAALKLAFAKGIAVTDEASAIEALGQRPLLVEGSADNLKVTTRQDLILAELLLTQYELEEGRA